MDLQDQLKRLEQMKANVPQVCMKAQKIATERAVEAAEEATPAGMDAELSWMHHALVSDETSIS